MGRAAKLREQRKMRQLFDGAFRLEAQQAKKPCETCAFSDPEAWVADHAMGHHLVACLTKPVHEFFCHEGLAQGGPTGTAYQVPLDANGKPDRRQLTPCGGFLRWAVKYRFASYAVQWKAVMALQRKMCQRYLAGTWSHSRHFRELCGGRADIMQQALNEASLHTMAGED
jgi:hypothetical protein